jgi:hypothetical protein
MADGGPRTKNEALRAVAGIMATRLEKAILVEELFPGVKMTPAQRDRVEDAMEEIARRLRLIGAGRSEKEEEKA